MTKNKKLKKGIQDSQKDLVSKETQVNNGQKEKVKDKEPLFPFDKMIYQEKGENENDIHDYNMESNQELNLGESESRTKKRTLRDEKGAGYEP